MSSGALNEFEVDAVLSFCVQPFDDELDGHIKDDCSSDASSDAGSDWGLPESFVDDDYLPIDKDIESTQQQPGATTTTNTGTDGLVDMRLAQASSPSGSVFCGFIASDTLRLVTPSVQDVMPELEAEIIQDVIIRDTRLALQAVAARRYQHNPYRYRSIPCRTTKRSGFPVLDAAYDNLPECPCATMVMFSAALNHARAQLGVEITTIASKDAPPLQPPAIAPIPVAQVPKPFVHPMVPRVLQPRRDLPIHPVPAAVIPATQRPMCCYFKLKGHCKMGASCWHSHEGDLYTPCHYGASCKAGHGSLLDMQDPTRFGFTRAADAMVANHGLAIRIGGPQAPMPQPGQQQYRR